MQDVEKVFIGSTQEDLTNYREIAIHACQRLSLLPIPMEEFGPDARHPVEVCLSKVDEATVYLGIYAHRYGYIPEGSEISITEMEYDRAIEKGIPVVLFVVDEDHPWMPRFIDDGESKQKLKRFKSKIGERHTFQKFGDLEKFKEDLFVFLPKAHKTRPEDLAATIHHVAAIPPPPEPYIAHPYTLLQTRGLIGRQRELNLLTDWVTRPEATGDARIYCVVAIGGMGKSALTWKWFQEIVTQEMQPLAGRFWWSFYESDATFDNFVTRALAYVSGRGLAEVQEMSFPDREEELLAILDREPFVLGLDGLERILIAYARMDAAYLQDTDLDDRTANFVAGAIGLPTSAGQSFVGRHRLRKAADPRAGQFLRKLSKVQASRMLISTRLYPAELQTSTGQPLPGCFARFLPGLSDQDALDLWRAHEARGSRETMLPVFRSFDKHPLLLQVLAGEVARFRGAPGDFDAWRDANPDFDPFSLPLVQVQSEVLAVALRGLSVAEQRTLHVIAGFRMPAGIGTLQDLLIRVEIDEEPPAKPLSSLSDLDVTLGVLEDRGLLGWDRRSNRYDLHPIVRGVTWSRLGAEARADVYGALHGHFEAMPAISDWKDIESLDDLTPAIELYNTLIGLERFEEAYQVFRHRLYDATIYRLNASLQGVEMLEQLFPEGPDGSPRLPPGSQNYALGALALGYMYSGRPGSAVPLLHSAYDLAATEEDKLSRSTDLRNLSYVYRVTGELRSAEASVLAALILDRDLGVRWREGVSLMWVGLTLATRGVADDAAASLQRGLRIWVAHADRQAEGAAFGFLAELACWVGDPVAARPAADRAWELAAAQRNERDFILAARLQGTSALLAQDFTTADERLHHALRRARACQLVELELPTLVTLADLARQREQSGQAREFLEDVWDLAEQGPYPLFHADALNVLAQLERDAGNTHAAVDAACKAYELAWCDGPPFAYHWGLEKAKAHLAELGAEEPQLEPFDESTFDPMPEVEIDPLDDPIELPDDAAPGETST